MQQAHDFLAETEALAAAVARLSDDALRTPTQFKGWTIEDVLVHLHFWNRMADLSLTEPERFRAELADVMASADGLRPVEDAKVAERGAALRDAWLALARDVAGRWAQVDPKTRVEWAGPSMSARSSMTARQMETWAHGQEVFDVLGLDRAEDDRVRNIVILGVNTWGWTWTVRGREAPGPMPFLRLTAPSGAVWEFGEDAGADRIEGPAVAFAQVVTQTRAAADTALVATGPVAEAWMANAQCFAGAPTPPPAPGTRLKAG